ncbi:nuclear transport factor 2 family protein [Microbulbifer sp. GL-2]|uniref:nuclear transport factor 2 family protein n=1 Tax=Microbulbifer sp. GL-2 TaxID=2591606 RepID=UPI00117C386B
MDNLQKNIEKLAILDLLAQYTLTVDNHDSEGWASLFTENGRFENGNLMIKGREKLRQYLIIHSQLGTRHITSSPLYTISSDGQSATGNPRNRCHTSRLSHHHGRTIR